jgi:hypothetical protein
VQEVATFRFCMFMRIDPEAVSWRKVEDEVIVLDLRRSVYISINPTGTELWPALVEGATPEALAARLQTTFGLEPHIAERDVDAFLRSLDDEGLLTKD